jgi:hypothetical protein
MPVCFKTIIKNNTREREMLVQRTKDGTSRAKSVGKDNLIKLLAQKEPRAKIAKN